MRNWKLIYKHSKNYSDFLDWLWGPGSEWSYLQPLREEVVSRKVNKFAVKAFFDFALEDIPEYLDPKHPMPKGFTPKQLWILKNKIHEPRVPRHPRQQAMITAFQKQMKIYPRPKWFRVYEKLKRGNNDDKERILRVP